MPELDLIGIKLPEWHARELSLPPTVTAAGEAARYVEGYGAVYYRADDPGTEFEVEPGIFERFLPDCFEIAPDCKSLFNHNPAYVLGSRKSGTLEIRSDSRGLHYRTALPNTATIRDLVLAPIERGDVQGASVLFQYLDVKVTEERRGSNYVQNLWVKRASVVEIGPVAMPCYKSTSANARANSGDFQALKAFAENSRRREAARVNVRDRMARLGIVP